MLTSDNSAANIVLDGVGGPKAMTRFIRSYGDQITRLDRYETELNEALPLDQRDTTTPEAMSSSLKTLLFGSELLDSSKEQLLQWMKDNQVTGNLLRAVLPKGWSIADRSGAGSYGSRSITAIVWPSFEAPVIITLYMADAAASLAERNAAIVSIGQVLFGALQASKISE